MRQLLVDPSVPRRVVRVAAHESDLEHTYALHGGAVDRFFHGRRRRRRTQLHESGRRAGWGRRQAAAAAPRRLGDGRERGTLHAEGAGQ